MEELPKQDMPTWQQLRKFLLLRTYDLRSNSWVV